MGEALDGNESSWSPPAWKALCGHKLQVFNCGPCLMFDKIAPKFWWFGQKKVGGVLIMEGQFLSDMFSLFTFVMLDF